MRRHGLYVYALLGTSIARARLPLRRIEIVPVGGLFAAAERLLSPPALTEAALRRQHRIVVTLSRLSTAVLPVRFGAFMTDDELPQIVRARRTVLLRALKQVRGRDQMTVRIFGPPLEVLPASRSSSGSDYLRARAAAIRPDADARRSRSRQSRVLGRRRSARQRFARRSSAHDRPPRPPLERRAISAPALQLCRRAPAAPRHRRLRPMAAVRVRP